MNYVEAFRGDYWGQKYCDRIAIVKKLSKYYHDGFLGYKDKKKTINFLYLRGLLLYLSSLININNNVINVEDQVINVNAKCLYSLPK